MYTRISRVLGASLAALALAALTPTPASATLSLTLGAPNDGLEVFTGPYATLDVTRNSATTATITYTGLDSPVGGYHFLFGDGGSVGLNVNGTGVTYTFGNVTQPQSIGGGVKPPSFTRDDGSNLSDFGAFNFVLDNFDGFKNAFRTITLHLTATANWATDADVLTGNAQGYLAASHIFVANEDYTNTQITGFAANGVNPVPEPGAIAFVITGLGTLGFAALRRRGRKATV